MSMKSTPPRYRWKQALLLALLIIFPATLSALAARSAQFVQPGTPTTPARTTPQASAAGTTGEPLTEKARANLGDIPVAFVPNAGQADPPVRFVAHQRRGVVYFGPSDLAISLAGPGSGAGARNALLDARPESTQADSRSGEPGPVSSTEGGASSTRRTIYLKFADANPKALIEAGPSLPGKVNYLLGDDPSRWMKSLSTFSAITYTELYPGVALAFSGDGEQLKATFTLSAGAGLSPVRLSIEEGRARLNPAGDLQIDAPQPGEGAGQEADPARLNLSVPAAWQAKGAGKKIVTARYTEHEDGSVGIEVGSYDRSRPLKLDVVARYASPVGAGQIQNRRSEVEGREPVGGSAAAAAAPGRSTGKNGAMSLAPRVITGVVQYTSPELRNMVPTLSLATSKEEREQEAPAIPLNPVHVMDTVLQDWFGPLAMPAPIDSFPGLPNRNDVAPPDVNGDIGPLHYIQVINNSFAVYSRQGDRLYPAPSSGMNGTDLWSLWRQTPGTAGTLCGTTNEGDPIAQYDQLADRWIITQFAFARDGSGNVVPPFRQCLAVSTGPDPLGSWYVSDIPMSDSKFHDYPKLGVWPNGYYLSTMRFDGNRYEGPSAFALERDAIVAGQTYRGVQFDLEVAADGVAGSLLPADLEGQMPPPGAGDLFAGITGTNTLQLWTLNPDWSDPANSFISHAPDLGTAPFDANMCQGATNCIPQPDTSAKLDAISDRLMYRLAYRNLGTHDVLVANHTVDADGRDHAGIRWYEIRDPFVLPHIWQQGTYAPDSDHRWMGSIAMDHAGNIALGYSLSGVDGVIPMYPSIAYSGRLVTDTLGTLPQSEVVLQAGGGSQSFTGGRWGDYTMLAVDPVDDCTFWYTNQYYEGTSQRDWRTRIGSFKFPSCGASFSTYLGGGDDDGTNAVAVDEEGNTYVAGYTYSTNFLNTNGFQPTCGSCPFHNDAVVTKLGRDGTVIYSTYLGGNDSDSAYGIRVDGAGNAYVAGPTASSNFPVVNALQQTKGGDYDGFVTKLDGSGLPVYSTYLGGSDADHVYDIAIDGAGSAYVTGDTSSTDFYTTTNALQAELAGERDAFVSRLNAAGSALDYSTYLGGSTASLGEDQETGWKIEVSPNGAAHVLGATNTTDFPTANAVQPALNGYGDGFVAGLDPTGGSLLYSTYLGGRMSESPGRLGDGDIALDTAGNIYVTGATASDDFPTVRAFEPALRGSMGAFVTKLAPDGSEMVYSTYLSGNVREAGQRIAVDGEGKAHVVGTTYSSDYYTTTNALQYTNHGGSDAFLSVLEADGSGLLYSTYLGGGGGPQPVNSRDDSGWGIALDTQGEITLVGQTFAADFPLAEPLFEGNRGCDPYAQPASGCPQDIFVTRLRLGTAPDPYPSCTPGPDYVIEQAASRMSDPALKTLVAGSSCDDCTVEITLPFSVQLYELPFNSVRASSNGNLQFVSNNPESENVCLVTLPVSTPVSTDTPTSTPTGALAPSGRSAVEGPLALDGSGAFNPAAYAPAASKTPVSTELNYGILPYWDDLLTTQPGQGIFVSVMGNAPSRTFNIEWRACIYFEGHCLGLNGNVNFEVRFYEGQERFDFIYGAAGKGGRGATIGVQRGVGSPSPYGSYTQYSCLPDNPGANPSVAPGLQLVFRPKPCDIPPATRTPTNTPTVTLTRTATNSRTRTHTPTITHTPTDTLTPTNTATPVCGPQWRSGNSPNPYLNGNQLYGLAAVSANDLWAVGSGSQASGAEQALVEHWDGTTWSVLAVPSPQEAVTESLNGVAARNANDVWAVGQYVDASNTMRTLTMRWNGTAWSIVPSPNVGASNNRLNAVAAISANDAWAVGYYSDDFGSRSLALHWDGSSWSVMAALNVGELTGIAAVSADDIWAVSVTGHTLHWNGTAWSAVSSPAAGTGALMKVAAVSASDVWAVGYTNYPYLQTLTMHWNGTAWSIVPSPNIGTGYTRLFGVAATAANDVWAVGYYTTAGGSATLILRWNGSEWSVQPSPSAAGAAYSYLYAVAAADTVWAAGYSGVPNPGNSVNRTLIMRREDPCITATPTLTPTGTPPTTTPTATCTPSWRVATSPNAGSADRLYAVDAVTGNDIWAVGYQVAAGNVQRTLIEHWDGTAWSVVPSPNVGTSLNNLLAVSARAANDVWAMGWYAGATGQQTLILRWNGTTWSVVPSPNVGTSHNRLTGVAATAGNDAWAVGFYYDGTSNRTLTLRWNGSVWSVVPSPNPASDNYLYAVAAVGSNDVWAVGGYSSPTILHWNGSVWSAATPPGLGALYAVAANSANDVWAVGERSQTLHWDGAQWSTVPNPAPGLLFGLSATAANDMWAVGYYQPAFGAFRASIAHWNGSVWRNVGSSYTGEGMLQGVVGAGANDVWAVGATMASPFGTLVERYTGECPPPTATPTITRTATRTFTPSNTPTITLTRTITRTSTTTLSPTVTSTPTQAPACGEGSDYAVTASAGATMVPGTALVPGSQCYGCSNRIALPFSYNLYGQNFNSVSLGSNGTLGFVTGTALGMNSCLPNASFSYAIFAHWDNLDLRSVITPGLGIYTSTTGVAPNRMFNIEWRACLYTGGTCGGNVNFEVRLYEGEERFDLVYGASVAGNGGSATVGVQRGTGAQYTQYACNTTGLQPSTLLRFEQLPCPTPTGTRTNTATLSPTSTLTDTPTNTPTPTEGMTGTPSATHTLTPCPGCLTATPSGTRTSTPTPTGALTDTVTVVPTNTPSNTPTATGTRTATNTITLTPSITSTRTFTGTPSATATVAACGTGANYMITQSSGASLVPGTSLVPGSQCYGCTAPVALPFTYYFYGQAYNSALVSAYGTLGFVSNGTLYSSDNSCLPNSAFYDAIMAYWDEMNLNPAFCAGCGVYTSISGNAPNRIFNIEWRAELIGGDTTNFEIRLYEGESRFDIVYGTVQGRGTSATVGVQRGYGANGGYTQFACNVTRSLSSGTQLSFTQPACATATVTRTPTGGMTATTTPTTCPACPTATPTGALTATATATPLCGVGADYTVTQSTGVPLVPGTAQAGLACNTCLAYIDLPFTYYLYGVPFTGVNASASGTLQFGSNNGNNGNACLPYPYASYAIFAFWDHLEMMQADQGIFTSVSGEAPERIFNIEWRGCLGYPNPNSQCNGFVNFEVRLYEGQERFDIVYGSTSNGGSGATVGVQRDNGASFTQFRCNSGGLVSGLQLTFTPRSCYTGTPTATATATVTRTPTHTQTGTPTDTSTPTPLLTGHVIWQGRPGQPHTLQELPITLTLKSGAVEANFGPVTTDASGFFTVGTGTLPNGTYNWRVKGPRFLANSGALTLTGAPTYSLQIGLMRAGDANNDNRVTLQDFSIVRASFGLAAGEPGYDERADLTGDQVVNASDFSLVRSNFGLSGSPSLGPLGGLLTTGDGQYGSKQEHGYATATALYAIAVARRRSSVNSFRRVRT